MSQKRQAKRRRFNYAAKKERRLLRRFAEAKAHCPGLIGFTRGVVINGVRVGPCMVAVERELA